MTERKVKLDRANKSILLRALGDVYYGQRARGGSTEVTGRLILRVNDLPGAPENYELLDMDDFLPAEAAEMKPTIQRIRRPK